MANPSGGEFGGFFARFFAFFCDQLIASALLYLVLALMLQVGFFSLGAIWLLMILVPAVYYAAMQSSSGQATIGKSLLGLKVATVGGDRASFLRNLGRELAKIISAIPLMIGYLMAAFTGRKQALHDMVASTVVLDAGPAKPLKGAMVVVLAFIANGAIFAFMLQDPLNKVMQGAMAEMQIGPGGTPTGMPSRPTVTPVAPKMVVSATPAPQPASVTPAAPKAVATPAPQAAPVPVAAAAPVAAAPRAAQVVAQRAAAPGPAPKPTPEGPPAAEAPAPLPAGMPARVAAAATPATTPAATPSAASAPAPIERPGVPGPKYNDLMSAVLSKDAQGVNELLAFGKWPDKPDSRGVTPLMIAVRNGDAASAEALLKAGADPNRNAQGGESAAKIAVARRDAAMTALLERYTKK